MNIFGNKLEKINRRGIDILIADTIIEFDNNEAQEDKDELLDRLETLVGIHKQYKESTKKETRLDTGDILKASVSVFSVLAILNYEKADVITSKAFQLIRGQL